MLHTMAVYLKQIVSTLNPFTSFGSMMLTNHRWTLRVSRQRAIAVICYAIFLLSIYVLFRSYLSLLIPHNLLTTDPILLAKVFLVPIASFTLSLYMLNMGMAFARTPAPLYCLPFVYIFAAGQHLSTYLSGIMLLIAFLIYYVRFAKTFHEFREPSLAKTFSVCSGLFIVLVSLAITIGYYHSFAAHIAVLRDRLDSGVSNRLTSIYLDSSQEIPNETLQTRAVHSLKAQNTPITPEAVDKQQRIILSNLGLKTAHSTDEYHGLLEQAIKQQITTQINNYKILINVIVPLAFLFVTNTLTSISCGIARLLLSISERIAK